MNVLNNNLIRPPNVTQPNGFKFVSNQYLRRIWFYLLLSTHYLAFLLYLADTDNVLYLRYNKFRIVMLSFNVLLHAISY